MSNRTTAETAGVRRLSDGKSVMRAGPLAGIMIAAFCVAAVAETRPGDPPPIEGRWVAKQRSLVLDVSRCGVGWCGVEVINDKTCGATMLRLGIATPSNGDGGRLKGRIELAAEAQSYAVEASFFVPRGGGPVELIMSGNTGDNFEPWRRNFPFREFFARAGDATCPPVPKVS
jgi:hypothetical protein